MKDVTLSGMPRRNGVARFVEVNRNRIVEVISALFILLFLYTALSKTIDYRPTVNTLKANATLANFAAEITWTVIIIEYIATLTLFIPKTRKVGLITSMALISIFTVYILYMMLFVPNLPCSCGGIISKLTWSQHLIVNLIFMLLALLGIRIQSKHSDQPVH